MKIYKGVDMRRSLSELSPQAHIEDLRRRKQTTDDNAKTLTKTLHRDIAKDFSGNNKYLFELLQNADDASNGDPVNVEFRIVEDYLILKHTGEPFNKEHVEKLCDYVQREGGKAVQSNKIGYKGIGFKSIFTISDCVQIISGDYSFRFDKNAFMLPQGDIHSPWPIIPLWTKIEETPACVQPYLKDMNLKTYFIVKAKNKAGIQQDLAYLKKNLQIILFLKHVPTITIISAQTEEKIALKKDATGVKSLFYNDKLASKWLSHSFTEEIPIDVKAALQQMDEYTCPSRLTSATQVTLSFAASLNPQSGKPEASNSNQLYCYLPTQVYLAFPLIINADFLLNSQRSELLANNAWNNFLLKRIPFHLFIWLSHMARESAYKKYILHFFPPKIISALPSVQQYYEIGYKQACKDIAFLPRMFPQKDSLLRIDEAWIDETGFFKQFNMLIFSNEIFDRSLLIDDDIEKLSELKNLVNGRIVNFNYLLNILQILLNNNYFSDATLYRTLLIFLDKQGHIETLVNKLLVPTLSNKYLSIRDNNLFILDESIKEPPISITMDFAHPAVYNGAPEIRALLIKWGIKTLKVEDVLSKICNLIEKKQVELNEHVCDGLLAYLFDYRQYLSVAHYKQLQKLPIRTQQNTFMLPFFLYLSSVYGGIPATQGVGPEKLIYEGYLSYHSDSEAWSTFFIKLGAKQQINFRNIKELYINTLPDLFITVFAYGNEPKNIGQLYLDYLMGKYKTQIEQNGLTLLSNLALIDFMEVLLMPENGDSLNYLSNFFYPQLMDHLSAIHEPIYLQHPENPAKRIRVDETLLQFMINRYPFARDQHGQPNLIKNLYFVADDVWLWGDRLAMPQHSSGMTKIQAKQLGYKTEVELEVYLDLLYSYSNELPDEFVTEAHMAVFLKGYREIIMKILDFSKSDKDTKEKIATFCKQKPLKLLSQNNRLTLTNSLYRFAINDILLDASGQSSYWIKQLDFINKNDFTTLCDLFSIQSVTRLDIDLIYDNSNYDEGAKSFLLNRLFYIALAQSKETNQGTESLLNEYKGKFSAISLIASDRLTLVHKISKTALQQTYAFYDSEKNIIFFKRQVNPLTINALSLILKNILALHDNAQKVAMIALGITNDEILTLELTDLGYTLNTTVSTMCNPVVLNSTSITPSYSNQPSGTIPTAVPSPNEVDFNQVSIYRIKASQRNQINSVITQAQVVFQELLLESITLNQTGRWGEELIYLYLLWHYTQQNYRAVPNTYQEDVAQGFSIESVRKKDNASFKITVMWHNKMRESGQHRDLTISKARLDAHSETKEKIIEVKTTKSSGYSTLYLSSHEVEEMKKPYYKLYRVTNAHTHRPTITKVKNLNEEIKSGHFKVGFLLKL